MASFSHNDLSLVIPWNHIIADTYFLNYVISIWSYFLQVLPWGVSSVPNKSLCTRWWDAQCWIGLQSVFPSHHDAIHHCNSSPSHLYAVFCGMLAGHLKWGNYFHTLFSKLWLVELNPKQCISGSVLSFPWRYWRYFCCVLSLEPMADYIGKFHCQECFHAVWPGRANSQRVSLPPYLQWLRWRQIYLPI